MDNGDQPATRNDLAGLSGRMDERFEAIDKRFVGVDTRFESVDQRFDKVDQRFDKVDQRFDKVDRRFEGIDQRFDTLDKKVDRIAGELVNTQADVRDLKDMVSKLPTADQVLSRLDHIGGKFENHERILITRGEVLDEHGRRISRIERHLGLSDSPPTSP